MAMASTWFRYGELSVNLDQVRLAEQRADGSVILHTGLHNPAGQEIAISVSPSDVAKLLPLLGFEPRKA